VKKFKKGTNGITLIALIITIIILILLVGITISSLTGSGLFQKAEDAVKASDRANVKEQLKLAVMASINEDGNIDKDELRKELEKLKNKGIIDSYDQGKEDSEILYTATKGKDLYEIKGNREVEIKESYSKLDVKVGDYVNYTPDKPTSEQLTELNSEINNYSGSSGQNLSQASEMKWRVLEIDEKTGKPTKLISGKETNESLKLYGANGYNNAVYLLNRACEILYSKNGIGKARSITIEDLEVHYSEAGNNARDTYKYNNNTANGNKYGDISRFTGSNAYYPKISLEENNIGVNTMPLDENNRNPLKTDGLDISEQDKIYTGNGQANTSGITLKQTYYSLGSLSDLSKAYEESIYYELFHSAISVSHWLASRSVITWAGYSYCDFRVRYVNYSHLSVRNLFGSLYYNDGYTDRMRPIVLLENDIEMECEGKFEDSLYCIWSFVNI